MSRTNPIINHVFWILSLSLYLQNNNRIMIFPLNVSSKLIDYIGKKCGKNGCSGDTDFVGTWL